MIFNKNFSEVKGEEKITLNNTKIKDKISEKFNIIFSRIVSEIRIKIKGKDKIKGKGKGKRNINYIKINIKLI